VVQKNFLAKRIMIGETSPRWRIGFEVTARYQTQPPRHIDDLLGGDISDNRKISGKVFTTD